MYTKSIAALIVTIALTVLLSGCRKDHRRDYYHDDAEYGYDRGAYCDEHHAYHDHDDYDHDDHHDRRRYRRRYDRDDRGHSHHRYYKRHHRHHDDDDD